MRVLYSAQVRAAAVVLLLAFSATAVRADDDPLAEAMRLEATLDYNAALVIVEREIARGAADHDRLVTLHLFAGKLAAGLERPAVAEDHFARVLALAPTTTFAPGTSPKITGPFDAARGHTVPLRVAAVVEHGAVVVKPESDPLGLVAGVAVTIVENAGGTARGREREIRAMQSRRIELPAGARATTVSALDAFGNRVWSQPIAAEGPAQGTPIDEANGSARRLRPLVARWPFWASGTAIALAAGGVCAWRFDTAQSEWKQLKNGLDAPEYAELQAIERRGRRWALAANISFGVAAASTIVAIITAARGSYAPVVTANGEAVGLAIAGAF